MDVKRILDLEKERLRPSKFDITRVSEKTKEIINFLKKEIRADIALGGSYAKGTMVRKQDYEVDVLLRFPKDDGNLSELAERVVKKIASKYKARYERMHGSRDYFRIYIDNLTLEVIPVLKIKKPSQEKNVTDLSYFHVAYVKRKAKKLEDDIRLAKTFCKAQGVYGAESYINGFSGYALECLIIHYKGFINFLKAMSKVKEQIVIDPAKHYANANIARISLNESKSKGPIILVDPTYKERNALAALSYETFFRFQKAAKDFLSRPSREFFEEKTFDVESFRNYAKSKKHEFVQVSLTTDRQEGDIAGTKMKKFYNFLKNEISKYFEIEKQEFVYSDGKSSKIYFVLKSKKETVRKGPEIGMDNYVKEFKRLHKKTFVKDKRIYAKIPVNFSANSFLKKFSKELLKEMSITNMEILSG